jgi:hypothetical protein
VYHPIEADQGEAVTNSTRPVIYGNHDTPLVFIDYDTDDCRGELVDDRPLVYSEGSTLFKRGFYVSSGCPVFAPFDFGGDEQVLLPMYVHPNGALAFSFDGKMFPYDTENYQLVLTEWSKRVNDPTYVRRILSPLTDGGNAWKPRELVRANKRLVLDTLCMNFSEECNKRYH